MGKLHRSDIACGCLLMLSTTASLPGEASAQAVEELASAAGNVEGVALPSGRLTLPIPTEDPEQASPPSLTTITIGPEGVEAQAPAYAVRSQVAGNALLVTFSSTPSVRGGLASGGTMRPLGAPVSGLITSGFGLRTHPLSGQRVSHRGVDVAAREGTPVRTTTDGLVSRAGWQGGYGLLVSIDHPGGWQTRYGHLSRLNVTPGQQVTSGDVIGFVGSTGNSTGAHLHYEVRRDGQAIDPALD